MPGRLLIVPTPIGNLGDTSERVRSALIDADAIACEDTRRTGRLLELLGIDRAGRPLIRVDDHTEAGRAAGLLRRVEAGETVALVTDAGTPGIADPGAEVIRAALAEGVAVEVLPGPSAMVVAAVGSGLLDASGRFVFEGFLPRKGGARAERLAEVAAERRPVVLYESPHRLGATLADLCAVCGPERQVAVARELTKLHEAWWRGPLTDAVAWAGEEGPRGEYVLVVGGAPVAAPTEVTDEDILAALERVLAGGASRKDAVATVMAELGLPKRRVYDLATGLPVL